MKESKEEEGSFVKALNERNQEMENVIMELKKIEKAMNTLELFIPSKVTKFGNSGHIPMPRKYIGKDVKVIILKEETKKEADNNNEEVD